MKLIYISNHKTTDEEIKIYENIRSIEFVNQEEINNGMWLFIQDNNYKFSLEFEPNTDKWIIIE